MKNGNELTIKPIPELIRQLAIPASVGFFFNTMYNVVDTFFGGLISTDVLAALSLSLPVFFMIIAMGTGISTGATALSQCPRCRKPSTGKALCHSGHRLWCAYLNHPDLRWYVYLALFVLRARGF